MVSRMIMFYEPQIAQMNKNLPQKSSLDLTLTQHLCHEDPELQEVCPHLKIEPFQASYYQFFSNCRTLVILL
jgi:hypothetical protein